MQRSIYAYAFFSALLFLISGSASAQITIERADYVPLFALGTSQEVESDTIPQSYAIGNLGSGNVWNFSDASSQISFTETAVDPADSPFRDTFPEAAYVLMGREETVDFTGDLYFHFGEGGDTLYSLGSGVVLDEAAEGITEVINSFNPARADLAFPVQYEDSWSYEGSESLSARFEEEWSNLTLANLDATTTVDAYGTLILPDGESRDALRLTTETTVTVELFPGFPIRALAKDFLFLTREGAFASVSVDGVDESPIPDEGTVDNARLQWGYGPDASVSVFRVRDHIPGLQIEGQFPNPTRDMMRVDYMLETSMTLDIRVVDTQGRVLSNLFSGQQLAGPHTLPVPSASLAPGQYYLQFRTGEGRVSRPFQVLR